MRLLEATSTMMDDGLRLIASAKSGDIVAINDLIQRRPELVDMTDSAGATALHYAALNGNRELASLLIRHGATINLRDAEFDATPAG